MTQPLSIECRVHFSNRSKGRKQLLRGGAREDPVPVGRLPRVSRLMALAIRFERLVQSGAVKDYAELARLGHVTRARVSQVMSLLNLAPDLQEQLLHLPQIENGRGTIHMRNLLPIAAVPDWCRQRRMWSAHRSDVAT